MWKVCMIQKHTDFSLNLILSINKTKEILKKSFGKKTTSKLYTILCIMKLNPFLHAIKENFLASKVDSGHCFNITWQLGTSTCFIIGWEDRNWIWNHIFWEFYEGLYLFWYLITIRKISGTSSYSLCVYILWNRAPSF